MVKLNLPERGFQDYLDDEFNKPNGLNLQSSLTYGTAMSSVQIVMDRDNQQFLIFQLGREPYVVGADYFRQWEMQWLEQTQGKHHKSSNFKVVIQTSDFDNPVLKVLFANRSAAEDFSAKLSLLT